MTWLRKWLHLPVEDASNSLFLPPGLYLIDVTPEKTVWVAMPNDEADRALPLDQATNELLKPALAALRAHQEDRHGEEDTGRPAPQTDQGHPAP